MFIPEKFVFPSWISVLGSRITDLKTTKNNKGKIGFLPFFVAINFTKQKITLFLKRYRNKTEPIDKKCKKFRNFGWGSEIRTQGSKKYRIPGSDPQHR
jgi:hypothetical protein